MGGVHGWVRGCDDRHKVLSVVETCRRIPLTKLQRRILSVLKSDGIGPPPVGHEPEESRNNARSSSLRIQLADLCNHHRISHASRESNNVAIDCSSLSPKFDGAKRKAERLRLRNDCKNAIGHTGAVDASKVDLIEATKQIVVGQLQTARYRCDLKIRKNEVDGDAEELNFDDGYAGIGDCSQLGDVVRSDVALEEVRKVFEEVFASNMFGRDHQCIDIRARSVHTQAVAAVCEHLAASRIKDSWRQFLRSSDDLNKLFREFLKLSKHVLPAHR